MSTGMFWGALSVCTWILPRYPRGVIIVAWTRFAVWLVRIICGVRYEIQNKENFSKSNKPVVLLSKHQSTWETMFLQGFAFPASTVLKKELIQLPFFGWGLRALRPIAIDRSDPRNAIRSVKEKGVERIKEGLNIILFPEGTRVPVGETRKFARSGADIAITAGVDIVPMAHNAGMYWPNGTYLKKPGTIQVVIGKPISTQGKSTKQITDEVENWINTTTATLESANTVTR